ncbi:hypothetical protein BWP39_29880 [Paraburkholderia acidicola]|nr:hypothetical protein BWP39_29880 [Paraburkholderia acidicola]
MRLLCFPHAGGTALAYRGWSEQLPEFVEVCPIQLPGRSNRSHETAYTSVTALLDDLLPAIEPLLDRPVALFGHSMGSALAFAVATKLEQRGRAPLRVFASARRPPVLGQPGTLHQRNDAELTAYLRDLGGTPEIVFENAELRTQVFRLLRADLQMNDLYTTARPLQDTPITTLGGLHDPYLQVSDLQGWSSLTNAAFDGRLFHGGHFFPQYQQTPVLDYVAERLTADLEGLHVRAG